MSLPSSPKELPPEAGDRFSRKWQGLSDAALLRATIDGHHQAFAEVHRRHADAVARFVRRFSWAGTLAPDVVQEVFLRLWHAPTGFDAARGTLRSYLFAIARGRAIDLIRADDSRRSRETRDGALRILGDTEAEALARLDEELVQHLLECLPDEERVPIELAYFAGLTYKGVATHLGLPEGTTKSRIRSGLRRMRSQIVGAQDVTPEGDDPVGRGGSTCQ